MSESQTYFMVGPFPPPVHGLAVANAAMRDLFRDAGREVTVLDTARSNLSNSRTSFLAKLLGRAKGYVLLCIGLAASRRTARLYLSISGGNGQYGDLVSVGIGRLFAVPIILHHHSFSYLEHASTISRCLFGLAGRGAVHITLCQRMQDLLRQHYPSVARTLVLSNASLIGLPVTVTDHARPLRVLGFLSNITFEKGIDRFLALVAILRARGIDVKGHVAGPIADEKCTELLDSATKDGSVTYFGSVYGKDKESFLDRVDVLIFPSRYPNEAEPFVVLESFASGIPVIASARGCIPSMIDDRTGLILDSSADDLEPAVERIIRWITRPEEFIATRTYVKSHIRDRVAEGARNRQQLLDRIEQPD